MMYDVTIMYVTFFVCKQKTAYEMRISDGSSDVCSSDLETIADRQPHRARQRDQCLGAVAEVALRGQGAHVLLGVDAGHAGLVGEVLHPQRHVTGIQAPGRRRLEQGEAVSRAPALRFEAARFLGLGLVVAIPSRGPTAGPARR